MGMTYFKNMMWNDISRCCPVICLHTIRKHKNKMSATMVSNQTNTHTESLCDMSTECYCCTDMFTSTLEI